MAMGFRRAVLSAVTALGVGILGALAGTPVAGSPAAATAQIMEGQEMMGVEVALHEWAIEPTTLSVSAGETVTLQIQNTGNNRHRLAIALGDEEASSETIQSGESTTFTVTFPEAGNFAMWCPIGSHAERGMVGMIEVGDSM
jgi:plastocyanin